MAPKKTSQEVIDEFWKTYTSPTKPPVKGEKVLLEDRPPSLYFLASAVLPRNVYAEMVKQQVPRGVTAAESVEVSYLEAKLECEAKVAQIVKECRQINQKYSDPYFDLKDYDTCLCPLEVPVEEPPTPPPGPEKGYFDITKDSKPTGQLMMIYEMPPKPKERALPAAVKRVRDIFDNPKFFVKGYHAQDIRQGRNGDCWFLSALAALCNVEDTQHMIERVCVARDEEVGVYGFLLYRDGEWTSVIVDDKLYLRKADYEDLNESERWMWEDNRVRVNASEEYRKEFQSNSRALFYAHSTHPDETWLPLLEKAFAKAHGDYGSIESGRVGQVSPIS